MTNETIILGCQNGEPRCQRELVARFAPFLMGVARRYMGSYEAAQDVVQDSFVKIFNNLPRYESTGAFEGWMRKIVVNTALQALDKSWVRNIQSVESYLEEPAIAPAVMDRLNEENLLQLIDALPAGYAQVFNLFAIEEYTHKEISEMLSISESTSRSQLYRARMILQQMISQLELIKI